MVVKINKNVVNEEDLEYEETQSSHVETVVPDVSDLLKGDDETTENVVQTTEKTETKPVKVTVDEHENCIAAGQINKLGIQLTELSLRFAEIEKKINNLENISGLSGQLPAASLKQTIQQVRSISSQVEVITEGLRSTPGYNIGKTYNCNSCKSMGTIAIKVRCTTCDHENWYGWWPQRK